MVILLVYNISPTFVPGVSMMTVSVLAAAVKSCTEPPSHAGSRKVPRKKEMYISEIIHHFMSERDRYILKSSPKFSYSKSDTSRNHICSFVDRMELLYGVGNMLRQCSVRHHF